MMKAKVVMKKAAKLDVLNNAADLDVLNNLKNTEYQAVKDLVLKKKQEKAALKVLNAQVKKEEMLKKKKEK